MSIWKKLAEFVRPVPPSESTPHSSERPTSAGDTLEFEETGVSTSLKALRLVISLQTDPGLVRTNNEDRGFYSCPTDPDVAAQKGTLVIVADGMGGAAAGEVASGMAVNLIPKSYLASMLEPGLALKTALEEANREIHRAAQADESLRGMGTACVALALRRHEAHAAWVGDSRLYLFRDDRFYQLSEDHTVVGEMVRNGMLTREEARNHEDRNVALDVSGRAPRDYRKRMAPANDSAAGGSIPTLHGWTVRSG